MTRYLLLAAGLFLVLATVPRQVRADDPANAQEASTPAAAKSQDDDPFKDKVLMVSESGRAWDEVHVIEKASFRKFQGRLFLIGTNVDAGEDDFVAGLPVMIAWESVGNVILFKSVADYKQRAVGPDAAATLEAALGKQRGR